MKIAFLHRDLPPNSNTGVATQVHRLALELTRRGLQVDVFLNSDGSESTPYTKIPAIPFEKFGTSPFTNSMKRIAFPWEFRKLKFTGYDIVHIHGDGAFLHYKPNFLRTFYGSAYYERNVAIDSKAWCAQTLSWWAELIEMKRCFHQSAISPHLRKLFPRLEQVIPCMLSKPPLSTIPTKSAQPTLLHVGSLFGRKQGYLAIQVWKELKKLGHHWRLILVCPPQEAIQIAKDNYGSDFQVYSEISVQDLNSLYNECWVTLSLSRYEGFGLPIIEALSQGCRVMSLPHLGAIDLLADIWPESLSPLNQLVQKLVELEVHLSKGNWEFDKCFKISNPYRPHQVATQYHQWYTQVLGTQ